MPPSPFTTEFTFHYESIRSDALKEYPFVFLTHLHFIMSQFEVGTKPLGIDSNKPIYISL